MTVSPIRHLRSCRSPLLDTLSLFLKEALLTEAKTRQQFGLTFSQKEKLTPLMEDPDMEADRISEDFRALQREARLEEYQVESVPIR